MEHLTSKQREVIRALERGDTLHEAAAALGIRDAETVLRLLGRARQRLSKVLGIELPERRPGQHGAWPNV